MDAAYITESGVTAKEILPVAWTPIDHDAFLRKMCRAIDRLTGRPWASGDFAAMRAAEYMAAGKLAESHFGGGVTAETQQKVAAILIDILCRNPKWRSS